MDPYYTLSLKDDRNINGVASVSFQCSTLVWENYVLFWVPVY